MAVLGSHFFNGKMFVVKDVQNGSFAFGILDSEDTLWLVRGDCPLAMVHLPRYKLYVYASTQEILYKALVDTPLFSQIKKGDFEEIDISSGEILQLRSDGTIAHDTFRYMDYSCYGNYHWWNYGTSYEEPTSVYDDTEYIGDLKEIAKYYGCDEAEIDYLLIQGFTPEEIEEYIYCAQ